MADVPQSDSLIKREPPPKATGADTPAPDPIVSRSTSGILLICALLMMGVLAWALYDEVYGQRSWKGIQQSFVSRYTRHLKRLKRTGNPTEKEIKESEEYQRLKSEADAARAAVDSQLNENNRQIKFIEAQLGAITDEYQNKRGKLSLVNYQIEEAHADSERKELREDAEELKKEKVKVQMPVDGTDKKQEQKLDYYELDERYNRLKEEKARILSETAELSKPIFEANKKRDDYLKENLIGLSREQVDSLLRKTGNFEYGIKQISVLQTDLVDRCETCHLGVREPLELTAASFMRNPRSGRTDKNARAFVSHPNKELLQIHNPEVFGCSSCHGGNGRATTSVEKAHGLDKHWLFPLYGKGSMEAGCQQCHSNDRVLQGADTLNLGKDLFQNRGCVGCHRYEGFDRESDALASTRQLMKQLEEEVVANNLSAKGAEASAGEAAEDDVQKLLARAESLRVTNSQIQSRLDQLNTQARYLMQDQKKIGPNLKDARLKLRKEWIPQWLADPQKFRPGTKMPTYWRIDGEGGKDADQKREEDERKAIAAYIWQEAFEGRVPQQSAGDAANGKNLFETRGCMACHSLGDGDPLTHVGGDFAANLQRVGEKANYEYIVRWIHNPRDRWAPYCPEEKRDLTAEDYSKNNKPFVFDTESNSRCPNDGVELQVQNMTVMPNFRLSDAEARDIASYLFSLGEQASYPEASFMDDPALKEQGKTLIKQYGCAGCHEIKGFEDEQRIGKELTTEGATPIERLDFALMTHEAENGHHPYADQEETKSYFKEGETWYNRRGFFVNKLATPWIYDEGKEKEPKDMLRMPDPYLTEEWRNALVTFLLGSVGTDGASVPREMFYNPANQQKDIQEGWWVVKKYNCMGCHTVQVGQRSVLAGLPAYLTPEGKEQLPPGLTTEGARVDPDWLLSFLRDPSLGTNREGAEGGSSNAASRAGAAAPRSASTSSPAANNVAAPQTTSATSPATNPSATAGMVRTGADGSPHAALKPQPGENKNGVRVYLNARMPTFNFSPNELRTLVRFFLAVSAQQEPYIKEKVEPLDAQETELARALFTSQAAPCLKCHVTGDAARDRTASAPNFLIAGERLKPNWTFRWLLDPQQIMPGTAMPSGLFRREGERWVFNGPLPAVAGEYQGDHAKLLVRYMLQLTPEEQRRVASAAPPATSASAQPGQTAATHRGLRTPPSVSAPTQTGNLNVNRRGTRMNSSRRTQRASRDGARRVKRQQASNVNPARENSARGSLPPEASAVTRRRSSAAFMP